MKHERLYVVLGFDARQIACALIKISLLFGDRWLNLDKEYENGAIVSVDEEHYDDFVNDMEAQYGPDSVQELVSPEEAQVFDSPEEVPLSVVIWEELTPDDVSEIDSIDYVEKISPNSTLILSQG